MLARLQGLSADTGGQQNEPVQEQEEAFSPAAQTPDDQYAALRAQLPYPYAQILPLEEAPYDLSRLGDEHSAMVYALLYYAGETGEYTTPNELSDTVKLEAGLLLSPTFITGTAYPTPTPTALLNHLPHKPLPRP